VWKRHLPGVVFFPLLVAGWAGSWYAFDLASSAIEVLRKAALPILTYTLLSFGEFMLITRTAMVDTLHEDYVLTARAKGLTDRAVRDRHVARNAMLPVISRLVVSLPYLMTGAAMIEQTLNWAGVGWMLFFAVGMQDIPLAIGAGLVIGLLSLVARLSLDVLQAFFDPRIRSGVQVSRRYL
jgi:peptide/nickel transport system permease protein